jgi:hypothetical protein
MGVTRTRSKIIRRKEDDKIF